MEPLLSLSCADEARRLAIAESLVRGGFELVDDVDDLAALHILDDAEIVLIRNHDETLIELTAAVSPEDILALVRVCLEVSTLWEVVRSFEDCESAGVIAANIAQDASNALVPALFAAEALTVNCPGNADLVRMVIQGCKRAMQILERITPPSRAATTPTPTCTNLVINELASTMRAVARTTKLVTRLETPLPPTMIERAELERMLLTLVVHATETRRSERVVVATDRKSVV